MDGHERWWTAKEAAAFFRVHPETIKVWLRRGRLRGTRLSNRAGWRVDPQSAYRLLAEGGEPGGPLPAGADGGQEG